MELLKIAVLAVATIAVSQLLHSVKSEFAVFPIILLAVTVTVVSINRFSYVYSELCALIPGDFAELGFSYLLKVTGICLATDFTADIAEDTGNSALSNAVSLFGRLSMIICILPLVRETVSF